jgi:hypothetical protein
VLHRHHSSGFPLPITPDETICPSDEAQLKQSAGRVGIDRCLRSVPQGHSPPTPLLERTARHNLARRAAHPAALFLLDNQSLLPRTVASHGPNASDFADGPRLGTNPYAGDLKLSTIRVERNQRVDVVLTSFEGCLWWGIEGKSASSRDSHRARVARCTIPLYSRRTMRGRLRVEPTALK